MIMLSGRLEEPGDGSGENVSLLCPPQMAFAQLGYPAGVQNRPPVSQIPASDMAAETAVYAPDQPRLRIVFRSSSQAS
jgi:hypothetical protein